MISLLSSSVVVAIVNLLFLLGIVLATIRVLRGWWGDIRARAKATSLVNHRRMVLNEIARLRSFRNNQKLLVAQVVRNVILEIQGYAIFISATLCFSFYHIAYNARLDPGHADYPIWRQIIRTPEYWAQEAFLTVVFASIVTVLWTFGLRSAVKDIGKTAEFDVERRRLITNYLKRKSA